MEILGIDIGGTGIKGAVVDTETGALVKDRLRLKTPRPATPPAVANVVAEVVEHFDWEGPVGCGFPAVIRDGQVHTAANIHRDWIGVDGRGLLARVTGRTVTIANDADLAGLAEMRLGAGRGRDGTVLVLTLGTGIGSALFHDGVLVPNTELGHVELDGKEAEQWASDAVRERKDLSWKKWSGRLTRVLRSLHAHLWPDLIILGGGVSKKHDKFLPHVKVPTEVRAAQLLNEAGIIGAALAAADAAGSPP